MVDDVRRTAEGRKYVCINRSLVHRHDVDLVEQVPRIEVARFRLSLFGIRADRISGEYAQPGHEPYYAGADTGTKTTNRSSFDRVTSQFSGLVAAQIAASGASFAMNLILASAL